MRFFFRISDILSVIALIAAAVILVYAVSHILLETILRSIFDKSTHVLDEFIGFAVLSITFLSLAWTLRAEGMIRVNMLTERLPEQARNWLEAIVALYATAFVGYFCTFLLRNFNKNWKRGAVSESVAEVPLWIPDLIVLIGAVLLVFQLATAIFRPFFKNSAEG